MTNSIVCNGVESLVDECVMDSISGIKWVPTELGKKLKKTYLIGWDKEKKKSVFLHRFITKAHPGELVDHKNGNTLDNRSSNLRICTPQENCANTRKRVGSLGFKGVAKYNNSGKFRAQIGVNGRMVRLGVTDTAEEAAKLYDIAASMHFGEFAILNFAQKAA